MERILNYTISAADEGMIVLDFLRKQGFSRHILTAMKADRDRRDRCTPAHHQKEWNRR